MLSTATEMLTVLTIVLALAACGSEGSKQGGSVSRALDKKYKIATVVKVDGIPWFARMREGVKRFAQETGHEAFSLGPAKGDGALQAQMIEELLNQPLDAICVVPFSVSAVEPVLEQARKKGVVVVSHEASNQKNADCILEAFDNQAWGKHLMKKLAKYMNYQGGYAVIVGSLQSRSHMEWSDAAISYQEEFFPNMKTVTGRIEDHDNSARAYAETKELLVRYPDLRGILCLTMASCPAAALATETAGVENRVDILGVSLVSVCKSYLETGSLKMISFWDPADAGYAMNTIAVKVLRGEKIEQGTDLGVNGYRDLRVDHKKPNLFYGTGWIDADKENMSEYPY
ncbi:MAG TPA: autoinducer 2 ABC transporter substrate-binding protein [Desulfomonilaceae bacterium]|nr:autoinducer 2 ABC transporter substrate-binding protein [Desulfomonilaceae bacterium]